MASSKKIIFAAIGANFAIAVSKFIGAAISGSSAMISEGIHSLVDTGNGGLLLLGMKRSKRAPDDDHPYGYGKSIYFYSLIVAILIFGVGGGLSIYEGGLHALHAVGHSYEASSYTLLGITFTGLTLNTVILVGAIFFESYAWMLAYREMQNLTAPGESMWQAIRTSKDPTTFTVLFEDTAAMAGLVVALIGIYLAFWLDAPVWDGVASVMIGLILCGTAGLLIWESKGLLLGESADPEVRRSVEQIVREDDGVEDTVRLLTMHMGAHDILLTMEAKFREDLSAAEVEATVDRLERRIREAHADVKHIFIEAESLTAARRDGGRPDADAAAGPAASGGHAASEQAAESPESGA